MILTIDEVKKHLKIDHDYEDDSILLLMAASEDFIKNATGKNFDERNNLAKVVSLFLIADMYENRSMTTDKMNERIRSIVTMLLTQLAFSK